jgi:hypothetical protein
MCFVCIEVQVNPGLYVVTEQGGISSTSNSSRNSENVAKYPEDTILEIIKIENIEQQVRGQIKDSLDWVSIKDTSDGEEWMKPKSAVTQS